MCLKDWRIALMALLTLLVFSSWFSFHKHLMTTGYLPEQANVTLSLTVQPDELQVINDKVQLQGTTRDGRQLQGQYFLTPQDHQMYRLSQTTHVEVMADITRPTPATNANEFDYRTYLAHSGIYNTLKISKITIGAPVQTRNPIKWWGNKCHQIRAYLVKASESLPSTLKLYVQGLFLGWRAANFYESLSSVTELGLIHLFSISGFHVIWVVAAISWLLTRLGMTKRSISYSVLTILPSYFLLSGGAPSLLRAIVVVMLGLVAELFGYQWSRLTLWGLSLLIVISVYPAILMHLGGQLSYVLAFALLFVGRFGPVKQAILLNLVSLPFVLYHTYQWHVLSLFVNLMILPVFSIVIFPVVLMAGLIGGKVPIVANFTETGLHYFTGWLDFVAQLPGLIVFGKPSIWQLFLLVGFALLVLADKLPKTAWIGLLTSYLLVFLMIHFPKNGEVTFFDIGQGDSFLIRTPYNRNVTMIDTGGRLNFGGVRSHSGRSKAIRVSVNYLKSLGIDHINQLCLSHSDADHIGDVGDVLKTLRVQKLYVPVGMQNSEKFLRRVRPYLDQTKIIPVQAGQTIADGQLQVVHPFVPGQGSNEDSMLLLGHFGQLKWLFTGDLDRAGELETLSHFPSLKTDVLKLGHHGSKTSSDPVFLKQLSPKIGIISAGRDNRYGHPNQETLATLKEQQIPAYNTQTNGMIRYRYVGLKSGKWETFLKEDIS